MAKVFGVNVRTVNEHLSNIFKTKELSKPAVIRKFRITAGDGKVYETNHYSLDAIISVGYRVNSKMATRFRQWATKTLRSYITEGYVINKKQIKFNYRQFLGVVEDVKKLLPAGVLVNATDAVELVSIFADTWLSLEAYDKGSLPKGKLTKKKVELTADRLAGRLNDLKISLIKKGEAGDIFGVEKNPGSVAGIVGNVMQSFNNQDVYSSVEEKAAHLLYFMVKNHPFTDGNKRSGAFAFIWFLQQAKILDIAKLTPPALTALTIMVAESDPKHKDKIINLILNLITKK